MKKVIPFILVVVFVLSLSTTINGLANEGKGPGDPLSPAALVSSDGSQPPAAPLDVSMLTTDFEPAEGAPPGFSPGYCAQNGWTAFAASTVEGQISTANPSSNTQHLRVSEDPAVGTGTYVGCFSPDIGAQTVEPMWMEIDVAISGTNGADYFVNPQSPAQGSTTARVQFEYQGNIWVMDDPGTGATMVDTGVAWNVGPYTTLRIEVDPGANTIEYYYGGTLIYTGVVFGGTTIEQVVLFSDNWNDGDVGDFDNLQVFRGTHPTAITLYSFGASQAGGAQTGGSTLVYLAVIPAILLATVVVIRRRKDTHYH